MKLGVDPGILYWEQGSLPITGTLSAAHVAAFTATSTAEASAAMTRGTTCILQRNDTFSATLTPDPTVANNYASFTEARSHAAFSQAAGSTDCSAALVANGGGYAALPCTISYDVTGTRTALPNQYGK